MKKEDLLDELKSRTIDDLTYIREQTEERIKKLEDELVELKDNLSDIDNELKNKKNIVTYNIVEINKSKFWMRGSTTEITLVVKSVNKNDEKQIINRIAYRRLEYADRASIPVVLDMFNEQYHFRKIISNMKLTKQIKEKYTVEENIQ